MQGKDRAERLADKICKGGDYAKEAALVLVQQATLIERLSLVLMAAWEWAGERSVNDVGEAALMKALWTHDGDRKDPCPGCDGECGEPCAPSTVAEALAAIDATIERLVKAGKVQRGEPLVLGPNV